MPHPEGKERRGEVCVPRRLVNRVQSRSLNQRLIETLFCSGKCLVSGPG
jgi:hypothetical protein